MKNIFKYITVFTIIMISLSFAVSAEDDAAEKLIYDNLLSSAEEIDLSGYSLSADDLADIFDDLMSSRPDLFFVANTYSYTYTEDGTIISVTPKYKYSGNTLKTAKKTYDSFISDITSGIRSSWSDTEKILYIHDYIVLSCEYDLSGGNSDVYMLARSGSGTCASYTLAFLAACEKVGIECDVAKSDSMNHIWNIVKADGKWYHVDVAWDDTVPNMKGQVLHNNFMRSDSGIRNASSTVHENWSCDYECSSERFSSSFIGNVNSRFVFVKNGWYAVDTGEFALCKFDISSGTKTKVADISEKWPVIGTSKVYTTPYSGVEAYGDNVYFNTPSAICKYDPSSGKTSVVAEVSGSGSIYFFTVNGDALSYFLSTAPNTSSSGGGTLDLDTGKLIFSLTYTVDSSVYAVQYYSAGDKITPPASPTSEGLVFLGWDGLPETMPENDLTVSAIYDSEPCDHTNTGYRVTKKATCTENGTGETYCLDCGAVISASTVKASHKEGAWYIVSPATCISDGERRRECTECGIVLEKEILPKTDIHSCGDWETISTATETEDGLRRRVCTVCGNIEEEVIPKTGESSTDIDAPAVTTSEPDTEEDSSVNEDTGSDNVSDTSDTSTSSSGSSESTSFITSLTHQKLVMIYIITVVITGTIAGFLIYLIVVSDRKKKRKK